MAKSNTLQYLLNSDKHTKIAQNNIGQCALSYENDKYIG